MQALIRASDSLMSFAARSHARAAMLLLIIGLITFVPGLFIMQPMDRDEPRFAQATKQMLETGDFVDIRFQDQARHKKPVGIYWVQAATVRAGEALGLDDARRTIWLYRLPSLLGALAAMLLSYWAALVLMPRREAVATALLFGSLALLGVEARIAKTDALMCATAVVAFGILARLWTLRRTTPIRAGEIFLFWIAIAVSFLLKGPVIGGIFTFAAVALSWRERSAAWLKPIAHPAAIILALLIVAPWFVAITMKSGGSFFADSLRDDMLGKVASGQEAHGAPPGLYALIMPWTFWPASALLLCALPYVWRNRRDEIVALCLAWIIPAWIMFELIPTKLPHYVLPLYLGMAVLTVKALSSAGDEFRQGRWRPWILALAPALPIIFAIATIAAVAILEPGGVQRFLPLAWALPLFAVAIILAFILIGAVRRGAGVAVAPIAAAATIALSWSVYQIAWPALRAIQLSPRLAQAVAASGCPDPKVATIGGYNEPSLVFLTRTDLLMANPGVAGAEFLRGEGCRVALVESREEQAFLDAAKRLDLAPRLLTRVAGVNINRAFERNSRTLRRMDIAVYMRDTSRP